MLCSGRGSRIHRVSTADIYAPKPKRKFVWKCEMCTDSDTDTDTDTDKGFRWDDGLAYVRNPQ